MRLLLINPNTNMATTDTMVAIARQAAPEGVAIEGATAPFGEKLIVDEMAVATSAEAVAVLATPQRVAGFDGVIVAAFGDPGLSRLRQSLSVPATGLAEAGMAEAATHGPFAVVTTTPGLADAIRRSAATYGHEDLFLGVGLTPGDPRPLMADWPRLVSALEESCRSAVEGGARAIVLGGGPLAMAARAIKPIIPVPVIEPVSAAVRLSVARVQNRPLTR